MGAQFANAYLLEKILSFDNLFVFFLIFQSFNISVANQRRLLNWGIVGALVLRGIAIFGGMTLLSKFHFITYVLGIVLVCASLSMFGENDEDDKEDSWIVKLAKTIRVNQFVACVIAIELSDIVFAVDSIPAVLAVTNNSLIAYTSNIFAILGLRSLFFVIACNVQFLKEMKSGIALILFFIGAKMLVPEIGNSISALVSMGIICSILLVNFLIIITWRKKCY